VGEWTKINTHMYSEAIFPDVSYRIHCQKGIKKRQCKKMINAIKISIFEIKKNIFLKNQLPILKWN
jgi:hypothetical protein